MSVVIEEIDDKPSMFSRPEWADVRPEVVTSGKCISIQYSPEHKEALSYFQALIVAEELSERMLKLTTIIIGFNQADFTAWEIRWRCVVALGVGNFLNEEIRMTEEVLEQNAKNYQLWNYRRKLALYRCIDLFRSPIPGSGEPSPSPSRSRSRFQFPSCTADTSSMPSSDVEMTDADDAMETRGSAGQLLGDEPASRGAPMSLSASATSSFSSNAKEDENDLRRLDALLQEELAYATRALQETDEKNYHAWAHRQAILHAVVQIAYGRRVDGSTGFEASSGPGFPAKDGGGGRGPGVQEWVEGLWRRELAFSEDMIVADVRNNSAWNQRVFALQRLLEFLAEERGLDMADPEEGEAADILSGELVFAAFHIKKAPHNESPWSYMYALMRVPPWCREQELARHPEIHALCCEVLQPMNSMPPAIEMLAEFYLFSAIAKLYAVRDGLQAAAEAAASAARRQAAKAREKSALDRGNARNCSRQSAGQSGDANARRPAAIAVASPSSSGRTLAAGGVNLSHTYTFTIPYCYSAALAPVWLKILDQACASMGHVRKLLSQLCLCEPVRTPLWLLKLQENERVFKAATALRQRVLEGLDKTLIVV